MAKHAIEIEGKHWYFEFHSQQFYPDNYDVYVLDMSGAKECIYEGILTPYQNEGKVLVPQCKAGLADWIFQRENILKVSREMKKALHLS